MKPNPKDLFNVLGLDQAPWSVRVYIILVILFAMLVLVTALPGIPHGMATLAADGLKTVLGALLGALSLSREHRIGSDDAESADV